MSVLAFVYLQLANVWLQYVYWQMSGWRMSNWRMSAHHFLLSFLFTKVAREFTIEFTRSEFEGSRKNRGTN